MSYVHDEIIFMHYSLTNYTESHLVTSISP